MKITHIKICVASTPVNPPLGLNIEAGMELAITYTLTFNSNGDLIKVSPAKSTVAVIKEQLGG